VKHFNVNELMISLKDFAKAIETGDSSNVQSWIDNGSIDVNARLPRRNNPPALVFAVACKQKEIVDILLRANVRIDDTDKCEMTACHCAALSRRDDVLVLLLARQPNLGLKDWNRRTPLDCSVECTGNERMTAMLIEAGALVSREEMCRLAGRSTDVIQALLNRGIVVSDLRNEDEQTPLHCTATFQFNPAVLSMLVNVCGVDLDAQDRRGNTCSHEACLNGKVAHLRWLCEAGAAVDILNNDDLGLTPLHMACSNLSIECILVLVAAGANVHARTKSGTTALRLAINFFAEDILAIVHTLIAAGVEIDVADQDGVTPRLLLAERGLIVNEGEVVSARRQIAKQRIDFVRGRASEVCIGLQSLRLSAVQSCARFCSSRAVRWRL
jgi:ankyrin repeat protein